jgi:hypothetical protein
MAQIDVSDVLADSDFTDAISVVTRVPIVDGRGQNNLSVTTLNTVGSVQAVSGKDLERIPEALRNLNVRSFWFRGEIVATAPGKYSSIIEFGGQRFQVKHVFDWTNWGAGWTEGLCVAEPAA